MKYNVPDYYKKFSCLAGDCPATCCAVWQIVVDEETLGKYRKRKGAFGNRLRNSIDWKEGTYLQYEKRCAFLNEEKLCDIHLEAGPNMMCRTCRNYPRHIEEFENEREITLSMSCPAAARLILGKTAPVRMISREDGREEPEYSDFDPFLYSALCDSREQMLQMLQNRRVPVHLRMAEVLALAHDVQNRIHAGRIFEVEGLLSRYRRRGVRLLDKIKGEKTEQASADLLLMEEWEVLDPRWKREVAVWKRCARLQEPSVIPETEIEQMTIYYLYTYYCGAVYDGNALAKAKMAIVSTLIWEELCHAREAQEGRRIGFEERLELAYRYSRELEHSDLNLNKMEEQMDTCPQASFEALMGQLAGKASGEEGKEG